MWDEQKYQDTDIHGNISQILFFTEVKSFLIMIVVLEKVCITFVPSLVLSDMQTLVHINIFSSICLMMQYLISDPPFISLFS